MTRVACQDASVRRETPMTRAASSGRKYKRGSGAVVSLSPVVVSPFMPLRAGNYSKMCGFIVAAVLQFADGDSRDPGMIVIRLQAVAVGHFFHTIPEVTPAPVQIERL